MALSNPSITYFAMALFPGSLLMATLGALAQTGMRMGTLLLLAGQSMSPKHLNGCCIIIYIIAGKAWVYMPPAPS